MSGNIFEKMGKIMQKIKPIGKDRRNEQQRFLFRGIEDVYNNLQPIMADIGVFMAPEILSERREERINENKKVLAFVVLHVKYTFYSDDGSSVSCSVIGEAMDSGDKASNKAMSAAHKYALFQVFSIPTQELDDPDKESHTVIAGGKQPPRISVSELPVKINACRTLQALKSLYDDNAADIEASSEKESILAAFSARKHELMEAAA